MENKKYDTKRLTRIALLSAVVVVLQALASVLMIGELAINLTLVPVVIGSALYGPLVGAWLGLCAAVTILVSGQAAFFFGLSLPGTLAVVLLKGILSGFVAGILVRALSKCGTTVGVIFASVAAPVVNTGIFLIGCRLFFYEGFVVGSAAAEGISPVAYLFVGLAGVNFLVELLINLVLSPVIVRLLPILGGRLSHSGDQFRKS